MRAYIRPVRSPLERSRKKKFSSSDMRGNPLDVRDPHARLDGGLPAVLVGDDGRELDLLGASIESVDDRSVLLENEAPPHLARPGHLGVVRFRVLGEEQESAGVVA